MPVSPTANEGKESKHPKANQPCILVLGHQPGQLTKEQRKRGAITEQLEQREVSTTKYVLIYIIQLTIQKMLLRLIQLSDIHLSDMREESPVHPQPFYVVDY